MLETITVVTLTLLIMLILRSGKTPPLDNSLVIERPGHYHMTLAPKINLAQPFIEAVAKQLGTFTEETYYSESCFFEVSDNQVVAHGHECYLLAITLRNGLLYFQAASPSNELQHNNYSTISEFSASVLSRFPVTGTFNAALNERLAMVVSEVAQKRSICVKHLFQGNLN